MFSQYLPFLVLAGQFVQATPSLVKHDVIIIDSLADPSTVTTNHEIQVGRNGFNFDPIQVSANIGDKIEFVFHGVNHSVSESSLSLPCVEQDGYRTGFHQFNPGNKDFITASFTVNDLESRYFFCHQTLPVSHCHAGMVFALNPTDSLGTFLNNTLNSVNDTVTSDLITIQSNLPTSTQDFCTSSFIQPAVPTVSTLTALTTPLSTESVSGPVSSTLTMPTSSLAEPVGGAPITDSPLSQITNETGPLVTPTNLVDPQVPSSDVVANPSWNNASSSVAPLASTTSINSPWHNSSSTTEASRNVASGTLSISLSEPVSLSITASITTASTTLQNSIIPTSLSSSPTSLVVTTTLSAPVTTGNTNSNMASSGTAVSNAVVPALKDTVQAGGAAHSLHNTITMLLALITLIMMLN